MENPDTRGPGEITGATPPALPGRWLLLRNLRTQENAMNAFPMYAEIARLEIDQRLRDADHERRRRLARRASSTRARRLGRR
jgi:hypothetical protein